LRIACTADLRKVGVTFGVTTYLYEGSSYDTRSYRHNSDIWYRSVAVLTVPHSVGDDEPHTGALVRTSAVLLGGPWAAAWLPQWSLGGSVAAAGGVQRYYAHVALPEDLVSIRAAETTYRYMRTPSQAVTRGISAQS
jgi:hypothetical protein